MDGLLYIEYALLWVKDCTPCVTRTGREGIAVRSLWWIAEQEETDYTAIAIAKFVSLLLSASAASLFGRPR